MNLSSYHLESKYREVLDNLSDEDKIKTVFKKTKSINIINDVLTYYELKDNPLHKKLALIKFNDYPNDIYFYIYFYAYYVIKGRWLEAEETIKKDPKHAVFYAMNVIKDRWIEAENIILKEPISTYFYKTHFGLDG
jgi:hypothetical protein